MDKIDRIFRTSDKNKDGCLDKDEFSQLLRIVNPEVVLSDAQLRLIQEEVWTSFPDHIANKGLTLQGLKQIYVEGYADVERDYDVLIKAQHQTSGNESSLLLSEEHVSGGRLGMAARHKQPTLADASPIPQPPSNKTDSESILLATPPPPSINKDIFDTIKTPVPALAGALDASNSLAFAVRLPGVTTRSQFDPSPLRSHVLTSLKDALPEGTATRIVATLPTPQGIIIGVVCCLPDGAMGSEEEAYFSAVLGAEPDQVFPQSTFGPVDVLSADPKAALGGLFAAEAAAEALAATTLAGAPAKVPIAFSVRLGNIKDAGEFKQSKGSNFMAQIRTSLPPASSARVVNVRSTPNGIIVTTAAAVPMSYATKAQRFIRMLRHEPETILKPATLGPIFLIAAHQAQNAAKIRSGLGVKVHVPGIAKTSLQTKEIAMSSALENVMPDGSHATVRCIEDSHKGSSSSIVTLAVALPAATDAAGVGVAAQAARDTEAWMPEAVETDAPTQCFAVGSALEAGFGNEVTEGMNDLHFGLTKSTTGAVSPAQRSPNKRTSASTFMSRVFGGGRATQVATEPTVERPEPSSPPVDAMIAGYQRRAPSSHGSSGLASAVAELDLAGDEAHTAAAAAEAAEEEVTPTKIKHNDNQPAVINVTVFATGAPHSAENEEEQSQVEKVDDAAVEQQADNKGDAAQDIENPNMERETREDKKIGWLSRFARSLSPQKRRRDGTRTEEDANTGARDGVELNCEQQQQQQSDSNNNKNPAATARALTPYELQQKLNAKEWAVMDAHVGQITAKLQYTLEHSSGTNLESEIGALQDRASLLPHWARHAAHMEIGEQLAQRQMFGAAARSFREAAAAAPDDPLARFRMGNIHFAQHEYMDASRSYFEALQRCDEGDPLLVKIHINMGISLESENRMETAEREYSKAAAMAPNHPRVFKLLGSARLALGDVDGAIAALKHAVEINSDFADAWADLGCAYASTGNSRDIKESRACLMKALALDEDHVEAHFNAGNLERQHGDPRTALAHYDRVLALDPEHWRSWLGKAVVVARAGPRGREREAAQCLQKALELSGHGGLLEDEVNALHEMLIRGAGMRALSQQVGIIEERARLATTGAFVHPRPSTSATTPSQSLSRATPVVGPNTRFFPPRNRSSNQMQQSFSRGGRAASDSAETNSLTSHSRSPSIQSLSSPSKLSTTSSPTKPPGYHQPVPLEPVSASKLTRELVSRLEQLQIEPSAAADVVDIAMLVQMQHISGLTLETLWSEALAVEEEIAAASSVLPRATSSQRLSPMKSPHSNTSNSSAAMVQGPATGARSKVAPVQVAERIIWRIVRSSTPSASCKSTHQALCSWILGLMEAEQNVVHQSGIDIGLMLCVLCALIDAPAQDRLNMSYRLLMWRNREHAGGHEDPVTRKDLVDLLSTLKMVFERDHKTSYLLQRQQGGRAASMTSYVIFEKFAAEVKRMFWPYEALPVLMTSHSR